GGPGDRQAAARALGGVAADRAVGEGEAGAAVDPDAGAFDRPVAADRAARNRGPAASTNAAAEVAEVVADRAVGQGQAAGRVDVDAAAARLAGRVAGHRHTLERRDAARPQAATAVLDGCVVREDR